MDPKKVISIGPPKEIKQGNNVVAVSREYHYADGTVEVWRTAPDADPETTGEKIDSYVDKDQQQKYEKENPAPRASTTPGDSASNSPADRALDAEKQREREWNRDNGGLYETHAERKIREAKETADADAKKKADALANKPTNVPTTTTEPNLVSRNPDGSLKTDPNPNYVPPKPAAGQIVTLENGTKAVFNPDTKTFDPVPVGQSNVNVPPLDPQAHMGMFAQVMSTMMQKIQNDPTMSAADKVKAMDQVAAQIELMHKESAEALTAQGNVRSQDITQRGQDMNDQASRRTWASDLQQNAYKNTAAAAQYMPAGSDPSQGMIGQMLLGAGTAGAFGGLPQPQPQVPQGPAQQQVMSQGMPGFPGITINVGGAPQQPSPMMAGVMNAPQQPQEQTPPFRGPLADPAGLAAGAPSPMMSGVMGQ